MPRTNPMPKHVLRHVLGHIPSYVLKHVPNSVLRHMPDKHVPEYQSTRGRAEINGACFSDDLAAAHYRLAFVVPMVVLHN